jgi:hypothetical protein
VYDRVDALERARDRVVVAHVADLELDRASRYPGARPRMHLRVEVVERPHLVASAEKPVARW